jgi:hypothetical protein
MIGAGDKALEYLEHVIIPIAPDGAGSYARPSSDTVTGWVLRGGDPKVRRAFFDL